MRQESLTPMLVEFMPEKLVEGVLYICEQYRTANHKCCCGCGEEVVTPLTPSGWSIRKYGDTVTLHPSIGNWSFVCQSHYWIVRNKVIWARVMSKRQIDRVRARDKRDTEAYIAAMNRDKERQAELLSLDFTHPSSDGGVLHRVWQALVRWLA